MSTQPQPDAGTDADAGVNAHHAKGVQVGHGNSQTNTYYGVHTDHWCRPRFVSSRQPLVVGTSTKLRLLLENPFNDDRTVMLRAVGECEKFVAVPGSVLLLAQQQSTVDVVVTAQPTEPAGGEPLSIEITVRHGETARLVGETSSKLAVMPHTAVHLTIVNMVDAARSPITVTTIQVANAGNVPVSATITARDSNGGVRPAEPTQVELEPDDRREVAVVIDRPKLWPRGPLRRRTVWACAELTDGCLVNGRPVRLGRTLPAIRGAPLAGAVAAFLVAVFLLYPVLPPELQLGPTGDQRNADAGSQPSSAGGPPGQADPVFAVDAVLDTPGQANLERQPVLVDREGNRTQLTAGGAVDIAVKVPSGWLVLRRTGVQPSTTTFELVHVRAGGGEDRLAASSRLLFWVDGDGQQVVVDDRARGATGPIGTIALHSTEERKHREQTELPWDVSVLDWVGNAVLLSVPVPDGGSRFDFWWPGNQYLRTPSTVDAAYLGLATDDSIATYRRANSKDCLAKLNRQTLAPTLPARCGLDHPLNTRMLNDGWSVTSPTGAAIALSGADGRIYFARFDAVLQGREPMRGSQGLNGAIADLEWHSDDVVAVLLRDDPGAIRTCRTTDGVCSRSASPDARGMALTQLVTRVPNGSR